jgi:hypothetical protein
VKDVNFAAERSAELDRRGEYSLVEICRFVAFVKWVDCRDEARSLAGWPGFHEPKRGGARADQAPIRVRKNRPSQHRVIVSVLDHDICAAIDGLADDAVLQRVIPARIDVGREPGGA